MAQIFDILQSFHHCAADISDVRHASACRRRLNGVFLEVSDKLKHVGHSDHASL